MQKIEAHGDKVLAEPISSEHQIGGLIISDASTNLKKAIIVKVGSGLDGNKIPFAVGDGVYYKDGTGSEVLLEGKTYVILFERDVWFYEKL